jgi:hypothetical protein
MYWRTPTIFLYIEHSAQNNAYRVASGGQDDVDDKGKPVRNHDGACKMVPVPHLKVRLGKND